MENSAVGQIRGMRVAGAVALPTEGTGRGLGREGRAGRKRAGEVTRRGGSGPAATLRPTLSPAVFAYGATGAGKTHTMLGTEGDPGIMYLTTMELYRRLEACQEEKRFEVLISYQEVGLSPPGPGRPRPSPQAPPKGGARGD